MNERAEAPTAASGAAAIDVAWRCAREGGAIALAGFRGEQRIDTKGRGNIVTENDVAVELRIKEILSAEFPSHKLLSEETSAQTDPSTGWTWVVDPIDGTKNYAQGVPFWCVNVALCHDGAPVLGITFDAVHEEAFWGVAGEGAFVQHAGSNSPLQVSDVPDVNAAFIGIDLGYDNAAGGTQIDLMRKIFPNVQSMRILGSAALAFAYVAAGRLDLFTHLNVAPWDIAAGILLVREAGGAVSDRSGGPISLASRAFAAGGRRAHDDFMTRYASLASERLDNEPLQGGTAEARA